jgi:hypothetical protein
MDWDEIDHEGEQGERGAQKGDEVERLTMAALAAAGGSSRLEKHPGVAPLPKIERLPWLISWAAAQGTGVGVGDAARQMLWRALSEGDVSVRLAAAQILVQVGRPDDIEPLRTALTDPYPAVTGAALEALAEIGRRYDLRIEQVSERVSRRVDEE